MAHSTWGQHFLVQLQSRCDTDVLIYDCIHDHGITAKCLRWFTALFAEHVTTTAAQCNTCEETNASRCGSSAAAPPPPSCCVVVESPVLVALEVNDGLLLALAESACLILGLPFHPQNPKDPEARKVALRNLYGVNVWLDETVLDRLLCQASLECDVRATNDGPQWSTLVNVAVPDRHVAYIITTSGSTGEPKGVVAERGNLRAYVEGFACTTASPPPVTTPTNVIEASDEGRYGLTIAATSRVLLLSSSTFDPSIGDIAACLHVGALLCCAPRAAIEGSLLQVVAAANPTHIVSTPALWKSIPPVDALKLVQLWPNAPAAVVALGGEAMPVGLVQQWAHAVRLFNIYGVTEATIYQTLQRVTRGDAARTASNPIAAGQSTGSVGIAIEEGDAEDNNRSGGAGPQEQQVRSGEVVLSGNQICRGYFRELAASAIGNHLVGSPFFTDPANVRKYRTGDVGAFTHNIGQGMVATLCLHGRRDTLVKINGQRVALAEVESAIGACGGIRGVICCLITRGGGSQQLPTLCAMVDVVPPANRGDAAPDAASGSKGHHDGTLRGKVLQFLLERTLPMHMVPSQWAVHPLPTTSSGKTDRAAVSQYFASLFETTGGALEVGNACAGHSWRQQLSRIGALITAQWERMFMVPLKPTSNFFRLGGDSLGALKMVRAVYLALHDGDDSGIDRFGNMPDAFSPKHLATHASLMGYIEFLEGAVGTPAGRPAVKLGSAEAPAGQGDDVSSEAGIDPDPTEGNASPVGTSTGHAVDAMPVGDELVLLMEAIDSGDTALVALLLAHPCFVSCLATTSDRNRVERATTPLHAAVASGHVEVVRLLLDAGACKITAVNQDGVTPAHLASMQSTSELLRLLIAAGFPPHARDSRQQSLLHVAARFGSTACAQYLLVECCVDPSIRDCWQRTAAHWAVLNNHLDVLRVLVSPAFRDASRYKQQLRRGGKSTKERSARLAKRRTHLTYETAYELAVRLHPPDSEMVLLASALVD